MKAWSVRRSGAGLHELERVYRARYAEYQRVATAIVGDADAARDAVQDAFASAVRRRASFRREGPLEAWLWRAVVNSALNQRRTARPSAPRAPEPNGNGRASEGDEDVRIALALLPERQRLVVFLRYFADLDYGTIAGALGVSPGTVAATLHAAHSALRRRLEEVRT
jgi:RNA polymerase sigma-70 factor (ECF subfamily)